MVHNRFDFVIANEFNNRNLKIHLLIRKRLDKYPKINVFSYSFNEKSLVRFII